MKNKRKQRDLYAPPEVVAARLAAQIAPFGDIEKLSDDGLIGAMLHVESIIDAALELEDSSTVGTACFAGFYILHEWRRRQHERKLASASKQN